MKASVVIPTFNKLLRLSLVLKSLECQVTDEVEVIVVFDGCEQEVLDGFSRCSFSYEPIQVICPENVGRSKARNKGIEKASGEIILFLDDDRIVSPNYIKAHIDAYEKGYPVVLGQRNQFYLSDQEIASYLDHYQGLTEYCAKNGEVEEYSKFYGKYPNSKLRWMNFYTGNVSVSKQFLQEIGGFDEGLSGWGHEDLDLGIQLFLHGAEFIFCNEAKNYHMMHASNFDKKKGQSAKNLKYLIGKYKGRFAIQMILRCILLKQSTLGVSVSKQQLKMYELANGTES